MKKEIVIMLGSKSDVGRLQDGFKLLKEFSIGHSIHILSAHRDPEKLRILCKSKTVQDAKVIIACAGLAAALPGFVASFVDKPVIGVPLEGGMLDGIGSLLSIVQVPRGVGLVSSGVGKKGFVNAIIFALSILSLSNKKYASVLSRIKKKFKS